MPAPIAVLKAKLQSECPTVRKVALLHVKAYGSNGRELAADVARLLEDDELAIRREAVRTFLAVGKDAVDALPVILDLRSRRRADKQLAEHATFLLSAVGDGAKTVIPQLKADLAKSTLFELTLCALLELAPQDPEVISALLEAPFRPRNRDGLAVEALPVAPSAILDRWAEIANAHIRGEEPDVRLAALEFAVELVRYRPEELRPCLVVALSRLNEKECWKAFMAARRLPLPLSQEELDALGRLASSRLKAADSAREFLSTLDDRGAELQPAAESPEEDRRVNGPGVFWARLGRDVDRDDEEWSVPPLPPEQGIRTPKAELRPLPQKEWDDLGAAMERGRAKLKKLQGNAGPQQIANEVENVVLARRDDSKDPVPLGAVFGKAIAETTGWSWQVLCHEGTEHLALVSESKAYVHTPIEFIASELSTSGCPSRISLLFTMLAQGNLPPAEAGSLLEPYPDAEYWRARRTALTTTSEISRLRAKATLTLMSGDRSGAIRLFEEAEALKSDPDVRQKLEALKRFATT